MSSMSIEVSSRLEADVLADETSVVADDELGPEEVEGADEEEEAAELFAVPPNLRFELTTRAFPPLILCCAPWANRAVAAVADTDASPAPPLLWPVCEGLPRLLLLLCPKRWFWNALWNGSAALHLPFPSLLLSPAPERLLPLAADEEEEDDDEEEEDEEDEPAPAPLRPGTNEFFCCRRCDGFRLLRCSPGSRGSSASSTGPSVMSHRCSSAAFAVMRSSGSGVRRLFTRCFAAEDTVDQSASFSSKFFKFSMTSYSFSGLNGLRPVRITYIIMPTDHTSDAGPYRP